MTVNGCSMFADHTANNDARSIVWDFSVANDPDRCMQVKAGQTVTFNGNFQSHPLKDQGGDSPNPFASAAPMGNSAAVTFAAAGTFGFVCQFHASMKGAILVVP
jgi:plastocyanin